MNSLALLCALVAVVSGKPSTPNQHKRSLYEYAPAYPKYTVEYQPVYQHYPEHHYAAETQYPVHSQYPVGAQYPVHSQYPVEAQYPVQAQYPAHGQYPVIDSHYDVEVKPAEDTVVTDTVRTSNTVYTVSVPVTYRYAVAQPVAQTTRVVSSGVQPAYYGKHSVWSNVKNVW